MARESPLEIGEKQIDGSMMPLKRISSPGISVQAKLSLAELCFHIEYSF